MFVYYNVKGCMCLHRWLKFLVIQLDKIVGCHEDNLVPWLYVGYGVWHINVNDLLTKYWLQHCYVIDRIRKCFARKYCQVGAVWQKQVIMESVSGVHCTPDVMACWTINENYICCRAILRYSGHWGLGSEFCRTTSNKGMSSRWD